MSTNPASDAPGIFAVPGSTPGAGAQNQHSPAGWRVPEPSSPLVRLLQERPLLFPLLIAATFLVVGMVFGALLAEHEKPSTDRGAAAECVCPDQVPAADQP